MQNNLPPQVEFVRTDEGDAGFLELVKILDAELAVRDGADHSFYAQFNKPVGLAGVILAMHGGMPVGCGAFKKYENGVAEIKRMFVLPEQRGKRIAAGVLKELEDWAAEMGLHEFILETGYKQPEAIALYKRSGYEVIDNYGQYIGVENSVCMRKVIVPS